MPTAKKISELLAEAGLPKSTVTPAQLGRPASNSAGFLVRSKSADRRVAYVYHIGRGAKSRLEAYGRVLSDADLIVTPFREGLKVTSRRSILQRGRG